MNILRQIFKPTKLEQLAKIYKKFEPLIYKNELDKAQTMLDAHPELISYINLDIRGWGGVLSP